MSTTERQNNLILNEDWTRIYQTFKNADFKSYDFENLRRVIIGYLRENYPEDFNDYIESSEYLALIDAIAFLGQSLSFRIDLASRENFIELAERKESVLRIARMLSYNAKRNTPAQGLLKFNSVSTTESIVDSNGRNLAQQVVNWNDTTNTNWVEQFLLVLNTAMADNTEYGRPQNSDIIQGIPTEQYRFRTASNDVPIFSYNKTVAGRNMAFELTSTSFANAEEIYEEDPVPGNQLGFVYRQDGSGPSSANTGFYLLFKQGSLELADFTIPTPTTNETVNVDANNINNDDVWLFRLNDIGQQIERWTKVSSLTGNNIAYNSIEGNVRNIYGVETRENDRIRLEFADGVYGNLPQGTFRVFYRVSNGLSYVISPNEMRNINISFDYVNKAGVTHTLTIGLGLESTIATASETESIDNIRARAPAQYYTQNRMITGEDYNLAPLASSQNIRKVKSINRTSSGVSRNFEIIDASGKYSSVNVYADDGYIYKEEGEKTKSFSFTNRSDIINFIRENIETTLSDTDFYNYYLTKYPKIFFTDTNTLWNAVTSEDGSATGYFRSGVDNALLKVGVFSTSSLKYVFPNAIIKFVPPTGYYFDKNNLLQQGTATLPEHKEYIWAKIVSVQGDGTNAGRGALDSGLGPVRLSESIPSNAIASRIVPKFVTDLPQSFENEMTNQITQNFNFGIRFDEQASEWKIIEDSNIDLVSAFSLGNSGDISNANLDSSWLIAFVQQADRYLVRIRKIDYLFGSLLQNRFYFDPNERVYNNRLGRVVKDSVNVLGINTDYTETQSLRKNLNFEIADTVKFPDGYESAQEIKLAFSDSDNDGVIDNPDAFEEIVGADSDLKFLFFEKTVDDYGSTVFEFVDNSADFILVRERESLVTLSDFDDGQLVYFRDPNEDRVKQVNLTTNTLDLKSQYKAVYGRSALKFQYIHNASEERRIDPSVSNIIDIFLLTRTYDTAFRNFLKGIGSRPDLPTSDDLRIEFGGTLNRIKSISDDVVYHPVRYKVLFGSTAEESLQARFLVVKNTERTVNDNDLKVRIVNAINQFFDINNWDFGDRFYVSELNTYIFNTVAPDISNFTVVSRQSGSLFGSLFEIQSGPDEIFVSGATVNDIEIVTSINNTTIGNTTVITNGSTSTTNSTTATSVANSSNSTTNASSSVTTISSSTSASSNVSASGSNTGGSNY